MTKVSLYTQSSTATDWQSSVQMATVMSQEPKGAGAVPAMFPSSQAYYWSRVWQDGEREAENALATGDFKQFDNAQGAMRWLLSEG